MITKSFKSYTQEYKGLANALREKVVISANTNVYPNSKYGEYICVFDTGATSSAINTKIARECNLTPITKARVSTAGGVKIQDVYLVDIKLPTGTIQNVRATAMEEINGTDVLIGMDIITLGDFAITNVNNNTTFSFRIPSCETIDYVEQAHKLKKKIKNQQLKELDTTIRKQGNRKCPCGSGKLYRYCCGREEIEKLKNELKKLEEKTTPVTE